MGFLSEAIKEKNILEPHNVFNYVRKRLIESITNESQKDGFDGILVRFNSKENKITYAASNNHPIVVSNNQLNQLVCDKMPVGKGERSESFKLYSIDGNKGDILYLYTDGYPDQFGGPKGKKYKYKPLNELLLQIAHTDLEQQLSVLDNSFTEWKNELDQVDDVCIIGIRL